MRAIFRNNYYDYHSGVTKYPWYAEIAPISYWVRDYVEEGKKHFNIEEWSNYSLKKRPQTR